MLSRAFAVKFCSDVVQAAVKISASKSVDIAFVDFGH